MVFTGTVIKLVLVGDGGVGKTTFIDRFVTGRFEKRYVATLGVDVHPVVFNTNYGTYVFNCWDCAGQEKFGLGRERHYEAADAMLVFFEVTSRRSFDNVFDWMNDVKKITGSIPVVVCGNKVDIEERKIVPRDIRDLPFKYRDVSVKSIYNCEKPFLDLLRMLTGHQDIILNGGNKVVDDLPSANSEHEQPIIFISDL